ncbi:hypothetical protein ACE1ET_05070 [Saccharicrinis sp. FJH62]|uniref:TolB family protein n=1 Tax=Saccharicrinis sp. FJH62 TaxID=3344657 RepID=UPI0035D3F541
MKTSKLHSLIFFLLIFGAISCEKNDDIKNIDSGIGLYDFYLYDVNSNVTTKITSSSDNIESSYSISPDSKKVLFVDKNGINEMNIDGSENKILVTNGNSPCYSPDGNKIAYIIENRLFVINSDGTNENQIYDEDLGLWHPMWSKNGEYIVCSSDNGICIISLDGDLQIISSGSSTDWYDWSNDSKKIFYSKFLSNNYYAQIFKYDILQDKESQITDIDKYNYTPKYNPVTNAILFTSSYADYGGDLITCDEDGLNQNVIIHKEKIESPCWSPNGDKIAFVTEGSNLAMIDRNGENYKVINEIPGACMTPIWSNDGNYILYYRALFYH